jgi:histidine triad (HIT) family protein
MAEPGGRDADSGGCIFCKIVAGQIPCHRVFEDGRVLAFLDIEPLARGHTLIIPKEHYATLDQMPPEVAAACGAVMPALGRAACAASGATAWNVLQNNGKLAHQAVGHVHFHVIPKTASQGLGITWPAGKLEGEEGKRLAEAIRAAVGKG